jgi:hypothetical protein
MSNAAPAVAAYGPPAAARLSSSPSSSSSPSLSRSATLPGLPALPSLGGSAGDGARIAAWTFGPALALLGLAVVLRVTVGVPIGALTRDRVHFMGGPFYTGAYSTLGLLLWASTAAVCFFTVAVMTLQGAPRGGRHRQMFVGAATLSLLLLADDMLMLHELVVPRYLGLPADATIGALGVAGLLFTIRFRREILQRLPLLFIATIACFAGAVLFDLLPVAKAQYLVEDGLKLLGIAGWLSFWTQRAALALRHPTPA